MLNKLRVICAIGGECWPTESSHSDSSESATQVRNGGVKMGSHEWSKSETSIFTNFQTALSLLPSLSAEAWGRRENSRTSLVKSARRRTAVCKLYFWMTSRRLARVAHCLQAWLSLFAPSFVTERVHKVLLRIAVHCHDSWFPSLYQWKAGSAVGTGPPTPCQCRSCLKKCRMAVVTLSNPAYFEGLARWRVV